MSARFHFDLEQAGETIRDEDGIEVGDLAIAVDQAELSIEELRREGELPDGHDWTLVIRDERGNELRRLPV